MKIKVICIILIFSAHIGNVRADRSHFQRKTPGSSYWGLNLQGGLSSYWTAAALGGFYKKNNLIYAAQYQYNENLNGNPNNYVETYAVMFGWSSLGNKKRYVPNIRSRTAKYKSNVFNIFTGPGVMMYTTHGAEVYASGGGLLSVVDTRDYKTEKHTAFCWKVEFEYMITGDYFAVGFVPFVNLNEHENIYGLKLSFQFGSLR